MHSRSLWRTAGLALLSSLVLLFAPRADAADRGADALTEITRTIDRAGSASVIVTVDDAPVGTALTDASVLTRRTAALGADLSAEGIEVEQTFSNLPMLVVRVTKAELDGLTADPRVARVRLNRIHRAPAIPDNTAVTEAAPAEQAPSPPTERSQSAPATQLSSTSFQQRAMRADLAWALGATGRGQVVVAIGNGVERTHDAFAGKIQTAACFSPRIDFSDQSICPNGLAQAAGPTAASVCPDDATPDEDLFARCGLGTHNAGLMVGLSSYLRGMAFDATLIPMQVYTLIGDVDLCGLYPCLGAYDSAILSALNAAVDLAQLYPIAAVNLDALTANGLGVCDNDVMKPAIDRLRALNILTVIPAGDAAQTGAVDRPACVSTALTVSSVGPVDPLPLANQGPIVDVLAPGNYVVSAWPGNDTFPVTRTSAAAAEVTGAVAMLKSIKPGATALEIETALKVTGVPTRAASWSWITPRVDLAAATLRLMGLSFPPRGTVVTGVRSSATPGAQSYLRFHNADTVDAALSVRVIDETTGTTLGTWSRGLPIGSAQQFSIAEIEANAAPAITPQAGRTYTLIVDADVVGHVQHVLWDPVMGFLNNPTACASGLSADNRILLNVHSSLITQYPSFVQVTNTGTDTATPSFTVIDARYGQALGSYRMPRAVEPGQADIFSVSNAIQAVGYIPYANEYHLILQLDQPFTGTARHLVWNQPAGTLTDLTAKCDM